LFFLAGTLGLPLIPTNTNALNNLSLREAERRSNPKNNEIATPAGLAMTCKENYCVYINNQNCVDQ